MEIGVVAARRDATKRLVRGAEEAIGVAAEAVTIGEEEEVAVVVEAPFPRRPVRPENVRD